MMKRPLLRTIAPLCLLWSCALPWAPPLRADGGEYLRSLRERAAEKKLSSRRDWNRLLHYRGRLLGGRKSQVDGKDFFLSPRGKTDPEAELQATLEAFFAPPPEDPETLHPQCRFPARYAWLKEELGFDPALLPEQPCERLDAWRARLNAESLVLVFASSYLNNPASMYGHTFLRLNQRGKDERERLNDACINFAADTPERSGLLFAIKGLIGAYPGRFSLTPYYVKTQQYNNIENRDLWEYTLNLGPAALDRLTAHLWELGQNHFNYFFLTENCSYQLLPLLEAGDPSLDLSDVFDFKAIPADTLRAVLAAPGLSSAGRLRPSTLRLILRRRALLSPGELRAAEAIARKKGPSPFEPLDGLPPDRQALVLDSAYDYFRYRHGFARFQTPETDEWERRILLRRGRLGIASPEAPPLPGEELIPPEAGHKSGRLALAFGFSKDHTTFEEISLRPALHDLTADPAGYVPDSQLEMFHLAARYNDDREKLSLEKFALLDIVSLSPLDRWIRRPSWRFFTGFSTAKDLGRRPEKSLAYSLSGGTGFTLETRAYRRQTFYVLAEGDAGAGGIFDKNYRTGAGGAAGLLLEPARFWRIQGEGGWTRYFAGDLRSVTRTGLTNAFVLHRDWEVRSVLRREGPSREALFFLNFYL